MIFLNVVYQNIYLWQNKNIWKSCVEIREEFGLRKKIILHKYW